MIKPTIMVWKILPDKACDLELIGYQPSSLDAGTRQLPAGGYTTFRTWNKTQVFRLTDHFLRLEESARLTGRPVAINYDAVRCALRKALQDFYQASGVNNTSDTADCRVRLILDLTETPGAFFLLIEPLSVPSEKDYSQGVQVVTRWMQRENPKAKQTAFIETASQVRQALPANVNEALMIGENGRVLEGLSSNFFAVWEGEVWTAEEGVLSGITRQVVLECINEAGIPLHLEGIWRYSLDEISEAFITSASRSILPVTQIDGKLVGNGHPGFITKTLIGLYRQKIDMGLETV